jgi:hypothetical protein
MLLVSDSCVVQSGGERPIDKSLQSMTQGVSLLGYIARGSCTYPAAPVMMQFLFSRRPMLNRTAGSMPVKS